MKVTKIVLVAFKIKVYFCLGCASIEIVVYTLREYSSVHAPDRTTISIGLYVSSQISAFVVTSFVLYSNSSSLKPNNASMNRA